MMTAFKLGRCPADARERMLGQWCGHARFVWNPGLEMRARAWRRRNERICGVDLQKCLTALKKDAFPTLGDVPESCLEPALGDQEAGCVAFFEDRTGPPRFNRRRGAQGARVTIDRRHAGKARAWEWGRLKLPGLGHGGLRWRKRAMQRPKMVTVRHDAWGRGFVSFAVEVERPARARARARDRAPVAAPALRGATP